MQSSYMFTFSMVPRRREWQEAILAEMKAKTRSHLRCLGIVRRTASRHLGSIEVAATKGSGPHPVYTVKSYTASPLGCDRIYGRSSASRECAYVATIVRRYAQEGGAPPW